MDLNADVTFLPSSPVGSTMCVSIQLIDDVLVESDEMFAVILTSQMTGVVNDVTTVTIIDDEVPRKLIVNKITDVTLFI